MITEDYVSFETAKLLKEKGFDEPVLFTIDREGFQQYPKNLEFEYLHNSEVSADEYACPTLQLAMKWLREVHNIDIIITSSKDESYNKRKYTYVIVSKRFTGTDNVKRNYEEACEAAIKYCLENLI